MVYNVEGQAEVRVGKLIGRLDAYEFVHVPVDTEYALNCPAGPAAAVAEIAEAVFFVASSEASFIVGETMRVDGGWTAYHLF